MFFQILVEKNGSLHAWLTISVMNIASIILTWLNFHWIGYTHRRFLSPNTNHGFTWISIWNVILTKILFAMKHVQPANPVQLPRSPESDNMILAQSYVLVIECICMQADQALLSILVWHSNLTHSHSSSACAICCYAIYQCAYPSFTYYTCILVNRFAPRLVYNIMPTSTLSPYCSSSTSILLGRSSAKTIDYSWVGDWLVGWLAGSASIWFIHS